MKPSCEPEGVGELTNRDEKPECDVQEGEQRDEDGIGPKRRE